MARPTAAPQHRSKRPFQPAITSYFHAADAADDDGDGQRRGPRLRTIPQAKPHHATLAPAVPDSVQSSLLSVGMRVRKAVPEGYKTPKSVLPSLQSSTTSQTPLRRPQSAFRDVHPALEIPHDTRAPSLQHQRELLPFCGLNKIGGYAEQPSAAAVCSAATNAFHPPQTFTQPFSSQDSGYASDLQRPRGKRGYEDDAPPLGSHGFLFRIPAQLHGEEDIPVSPLSESPPPSLPPQRLLAQPRARRHGRQRASDADMDWDMDREGARVHEGRLAAGHASDFEEADFLDGEVGMGGV
ncbi:uncharacterized protein M421DRAFT_6378 [Didymella exigua CBS 183.55]|uniref:Uncharacterized protein n=1 Tax=Didymella exigua CBS 183.55 TaxID=1150837 RepID=A0A6A5RLE3_9PLEO|nr:uncharacterized protein M421DRAFT_6378 [Didymella exigua CBS 183.55]KAF1927186.1 hypothetical protein M421DRAFT_6378 [Didymella exigua CBS 183.55]